MIVFLAILAIIIIAIVSGIVKFTGLSPTVTDPATAVERPANFIELIWMGLMRTLDAGTMGGDTGSWWFLIAMFVITLVGVFVVSSLIGILSSGLDFMGVNEDYCQVTRYLFEQLPELVDVGYNPKLPLHP